MWNSSIWPKYRTLSSTTTLGQSGPGSNGKEEVLYIPQSTKTGTSPSDCLMRYPGHPWSVCVGGVLPLCRDPVSVLYSPSQLGPQIHRGLSGADSSLDLEALPRLTTWQLAANTAQVDYHNMLAANLKPKSTTNQPLGCQQACLSNPTCLNPWVD